MFCCSSARAETQSSQSVAKTRDSAKPAYFERPKTVSVISDAPAWSPRPPATPAT